jgi:predicted nuclease with TOPRIM domain
MNHSPTLHAQFTRRLEELRADFARGEERLKALDTEAQQLRQTMLRISGAIQVLEEELAAPPPQAPDA